MWKWLNSIFFIVLSGFCSAQKPMVQLMVDPKNAQVGEEITVTVKSNIFGSLEIDLPSSYTSGGSVSTITESDNSSGTMVTYVYHSQNGYLTKEGTFTIGPAYVKRGRKVFKSNSVSIKVEKEQQNSSQSEVSSKQLKKPAFGVIEKSKAKIYEGEPVVLSAKVYARFEPTHIEDYQPFEMEGVSEKHSLGGSQQIKMEQKTIKGMGVYCFEYDKQVVFPTGTGKITINPFKLNLKVGFDGYPFSSSGTSIEVVPLPSSAPTDFNGGVGKFSISSTINKNSFNQGDVFELSVVVDGVGNIHAITSPKLNLPKGMTQYGDPIITEDYSFGISGSEGKVTYKYNVQIVDAGTFNFPGIGISYFDVLKQQYVSIKTSNEKLNVLSDSKFASSNITDETKPIENNEIGMDNSLNSKIEEDKKPFYKSSIFLFAVCSPLVFGFLFLVMKKRKEKGREEFDKSEKLKVFKTDSNQYYKKAVEECKNNNEGEFYHAIQFSILSGCCFMLKNDEVLTLSKKELFDKLNENRISIELQDEIKSIFQSCESARFGMGIESGNQELILKMTKNCLDQLLN